ncbi:protein kinase [Streptomyces sp. NPDC052682]|uniref:protein kinase domain-containing protein n=1 Tax=Streptomyces sp. NPDC052682 TaxID=3154954 RepID=UPI00341F2EE7
MALRETDPAEVGGYRIEDRLGSGGMGVVYLARTASGRRLAVKVVHGQYADDDEFRARFRREVAAARQVSGAFTAPVVDADADAPRPWMATLYIPGEDLGTHVRRHGPLPVQRLRELAVGLAEALRDIHRAGVVHRDLKPANVMLAEDGTRVIDFGISRAAEFAASDALTQTGRVMGTPPFMSPEQFSSPHDVGPAADVFSLGSVLVYAATRRGPFDSVSPYETAVKVVEGEPDLTGVPGELLPLVRLCLNKHPKSRPTPGDLLALLRDGRLPEPSPAREAPDGEEPVAGQVPTGPARPRRRRFRLAGAAVAVVLAAVAVTAVVLVRGGPTSGADASAPGAPRPSGPPLPDGWRSWSSAAGGDSRGTTFRQCAATGRSLVCAGSDLSAARFSLADGGGRWSRTLDPTPDGTLSDRGSLIGAEAGRVYTYRADDYGVGTPLTRFTVLAQSADTGKVLWQTVTGDGGAAYAPAGDEGGSTVVPGGIVALYGDRGESYVLIDSDDGEIRWTRRLPAPAGCEVQGAAARAYLLCHSGKQGAADARTRVSLIDPATGEPRWTVRAKGTLDLLGEHQGHLVLAQDYPFRRALTLVDASAHTVTTVRLAKSLPDTADVHLAGGTVYCTLPGGRVLAFAPRTGRLRWESNSTVERQGPPTAGAAHVYFASPSGRVAALDTTTGKVARTWPGRDDAGSGGFGQLPGAPVTLVGGALYVPYGIRSVYTVDVSDL